MKIKNCINFITLSTLVGLGGCADPTYREPAHGPVAYLSFKQNPEIQSAEVKTYADGNTCRGKGDLSSFIEKNATIKIPAGQQATFWINWDNYFSQCAMFFSFLPEVNQKYILYFKITPQAQQCDVKVGKILNGEITAVPLHTRTPNFQISYNDPACKPLK